MRYLSTPALAGGLLLGAVAGMTLAGGPPDANTALKLGTKAPAFTLKD
jgi:hypothetical protein